MPKGQYARPTVAERFWPKVDMTGDGCWEWQASRFRRPPYGQFQYEGRPHVAHRIAWILSNGPIPEGKKVLHSCDNPPCCRPSHLFIGTDSDNMKDMISKGRGKPWGKNQVTPGQRLAAIRLLDEGQLSQNAIARAVGIHSKTIALIKADLHD